ncbi:MAG: hypothetical protein NW203_07225 [Hyphomonadaceae bacterium]|nr:hypothetical protein [Hyphomonadaceae bacterium]
MVRMAVPGGAARVAAVAFSGGASGASEVPLAHNRAEWPPARQEPDPHEAACVLDVARNMHSARANKPNAMRGETQ